MTVILISMIFIHFLRDDRIGIIGSNGCGKSTLMKIITGQIQPDSGSVEIGDTVHIGYFMQEMNRWMRIRQCLSL